MIMWSQRNAVVEVERKVISFRQESFNSMFISSAKNRMLLMCGQSEKVLTIWDFDVLNLIEVIEFEYHLVSAVISQNLNFIVVGLSNMTVVCIEFKKKEHRLELTTICKIDLNEHLPKDHLELDQHGISSIGLPSLASGHQLVIATNRGLVFNFDIFQVMSHNFVLPDLSSPKESPNILRNQREDFQTCLSQRGHRQHISKLSDLSDESYNKGLLLWVKKMSKECISMISRLGIRDKLVGLLCQDYSKIVNLSTGSI